MPSECLTRTAGSHTLLEAVRAGELQWRRHAAGLVPPQAAAAGAEVDHVARTSTQVPFATCAAAPTAHARHSASRCGPQICPPSDGCAPVTAFCAGFDRVPSCHTSRDC